MRACRASQSSNSSDSSYLSPPESRASHSQLLLLTPACAVPEFAAASMRARNGFVDDLERLAPEDESTHIPLSRGDGDVGIGGGVGISG